jgi:hypothetical protein
MKNPVLFYGVIALGAIAIAIGIVYLTGALGAHSLRPYVALGVGAVLVIGGVVGIFMSRTPNMAAK